MCRKIAFKTCYRPWSWPVSLVREWKTALSLEACCVRLIASESWLPCLQVFLLLLVHLLAPGCVAEAAGSKQRDSERYARGGKSSSEQHNAERVRHAAQGFDASTAHVGMQLAQQDADEQGQEEELRAPALAFSRELLQDEDVVFADSDPVIITPPPGSGGSLFTPPGG